MKSERREDDCWREREEEESGGGDGTNKELKGRFSLSMRESRIVSWSHKK